MQAVLNVILHADISPPTVAHVCAELDMGNIPSGANGVAVPEILGMAARWAGCACCASADYEHVVCALCSPSSTAPNPHFSLHEPFDMKPAVFLLPVRFCWMAHSVDLTSVRTWTDG